MREFWSSAWEMSEVSFLIAESMSSLVLLFP